MTSLKIYSTKSKLYLPGRYTQIGTAIFHDVLSEYNLDCISIAILRLCIRNLASADDIKSILDHVFSVDKKTNMMIRTRVIKYKYLKREN